LPIDDAVRGAAFGDNLGVLRQMSLRAGSGEQSSVDPAIWVDEHGDVLFRYAMMRLRDRAAAEDLVQETLLAAIQGIDGVSNDSTVRAWLLGIMRHKVVDYIRRQVRDRRIWESDRDASTEQDFDERGAWAVAVSDWGSPEKMLHNAEFWAAFERCFDELPGNLRSTFALREFDGLDTEALASVLSTTKNNLWVMLSRARQRLRNCLQAHWIEA
jgi:RNA polymerase sigma-70 factor (ECF subfamily)